MATKRYPKFNFNTILFILLAIIMLYLLARGFMWAWGTMAGWNTL